MTIRLYVPAYLALNQIVDLEKAQSHYLANVMRVRQGSYLNLFNAESGEFISEITFISKNSISAIIKEQFKPALQKENNFTLGFSPIKNPSSSYIVQKGTELGVTSFLPIITERTIVRNLSTEKLESVAIEAAEQSERLSIPKILEPIKLPTLTKIAQQYSHVFFCYEREEKRNSLLSTLISHKDELNNSLILTGPEGGFSESEISIIQSLDNVKSVSLGDKILRADTAIISALATFNAVFNL